MACWCACQLSILYAKAIIFPFISINWSHFKRKIELKTVDTHTRYTNSAISSCLKIIKNYFDNEIPFSLKHIRFLFTLQIVINFSAFIYYSFNHAFCLFCIWYRWSLHVVKCVSLINKENLLPVIINCMHHLLNKIK